MIFMLFLCAFVLLRSQSALAHVKWFSHFKFDEPVSFAALSHPTFWGLLALSVVTVAILVFVDKKLENSPGFIRANTWLASYSDQSTVILRIFTGASLLLSWQADSMIAPDLKISAQAVGWWQFAIALLLLFRRTTPVAGAGMLFLYVFATSQYGVFRLLDYVVYATIGYFFLVSEAKKEAVKNTRLPALYLGLGFSLCWVALEKIFYPDWGLEVLQNAPALTMGLEPRFFLLSCAFVEFSLGYCLMICMLHRTIAVTVTLVFFTTTMFFGKTEVVGHTLLHGALLVFCVMGAGDFYKPPIALHRKLGLRVAFAAVNFLVIFTLLAVPYRILADRAHRGIEPAASQTE